MSRLTFPGYDKDEGPEEKNSGTVFKELHELTDCEPPELTIFFEEE